MSGEWFKPTGLPLDQLLEQWARVFECAAIPIEPPRSFSYEPSFPEKISWMDVYRVTSVPPKMNVGYLFSNIAIGADDCVPMNRRKWRALKRRLRRPNRPSHGMRRHVRRMKAEKRRREC